MTADLMTANRVVAGKGSPPAQTSSVEDDCSGQPEAILNRSGKRLKSLEAKRPIVQNKKKEQRLEIVAANLLKEKKPK
jgi:hypothetical protein